MKNFMVQTQIVVTFFNIHLFIGGLQGLHEIGVWTMLQAYSAESLNTHFAWTHLKSVTFDSADSANFNSKIDLADFDSVIDSVIDSAAFTQKLTKQILTQSLT
mgnify:CR=1 FL=1